jgi:hypothetical protein
MIKIKIVRDKDQLEEMDKDGNENPNERKARLFPGYDQMRQLGKGIAEEGKDFSNCKQKELEKKYSTDKKTKARKVELDQKLECDFQPLKPIDPKIYTRWKKLARLQDKYEATPQITIGKPIFDNFMKWLDAEATA